MAVGSFLFNLLGLDLLKGKELKDSSGRSWAFGTAPVNIHVLQTASLLPPSKLTNVRPYLPPLGAQEGIMPVLEELKEQGNVVPAHSPFNSLVWPVRIPNGKWRLTVGSLMLTQALTAAVPSIAELIASIQAQAHPIMATTDVKDMFFT